MCVKNITSPYIYFKSFRSDIISSQNLVDHDEMIKVCRGAIITAN